MSAFQVTKRNRKEMAEKLNSNNSNESNQILNKHVLQVLLKTIKDNENLMEDRRTSLSKVSQRKISQKKSSDKCVHCDAKVDLDKLKEFVTCKGCDKLACYNQKCSEFVYGLNVWECARCQKNRVIQQRAGEWLLNQLNQMKDNDEVTKINKEDTMNNKYEEQNLAAFVSHEQRDKVRQFIEELLAKLVDGPLDDVTVGQVSRLPLIGPIPANVTHHELKMFIQEICEDIMNLPRKFNFSGVSSKAEEPLPYFDPKKYEQLLATAVLNKMTDFYQNPNDKNSQNNSSGVHSDIELDSNHNHLNEKAVIDLMVERDEAIKQKVNSQTIEKHHSKADNENHLSDYIQIDIQSANSSNATDATWEDNWLFKKRKLKTENQSIAMLVPSPTEDIKALIGDKNADETSDLSENSDIEEESKFRIVTDKKVAEENVYKKFTQITAHDSLKSMQSLTSLEIGPGTITEAKNNLLLVNDPILNTPETIQKTGDFKINEQVTANMSALSDLSVQINESTEEDFDSMVSPTQVREHKKSIDDEFEKLLMDDNNNSKGSISLPNTVKNNKRSSTEDKPSINPVPEKRSSINDPEKVLMENVVPGSIADREHRKWLHAPPIANNPYSTEALQRRLSEPDQKQKTLDLSNNSKIVDALVEESNSMDTDNDEDQEVFQQRKLDIKKYKRDYYINDATEAHLNRTSYGSNSSTSSNIKTDDDRSDNVTLLVSISEKGFSPPTLQTSDIDTTAGGLITLDQVIVSTSHEKLSLTPKSEKSNDNSLTYSENSDTTRVYNLNTGETKIIVPIVESPVKFGQQFFDTSTKKVQTIRKMDDEVTTVIRTSHRSLHNGNNVSETYEDKQVIEPDVVESLPSVKKLAEIYGKEASSTQDIILKKPKTFSATSENGIETTAHQAITKTTSEVLGPSYNNNYHPAAPIASITARSIPSQIRADLKKSISYDEESIVRHNEREGSPEIQPGVTRSSIAFFENLKNN
ncbi:CLUMA_CG011521, isoform B [Clunio marinus]|uniref:CLUMA_CG011521, isoform B n=1 Tax=Clunio marinus TaxID=568069 RepID=A0A1J1IEF6_9DIPT|nr:CLUMA_CG011521, isoform B [Clunio marinus]